MYEDNQDPVASLVHLYVDGAFSRRELINRVAKITGSLAAAVTAVETMGVAEAQTTQACPEGVRVPAEAPDIDARDVEYPGDAGPLYGYLVRPRNSPAADNPVVITIHENQGLTEHHKDVARRVARAGYVALAIDLLSRQGGTSQFQDPQALAQAYGRTVPQQRDADMYSTMTYVRQLPGVRPDRIGAVGFCAGGGNVWNLATGAPDLT
ncbi:MAG: dienelactone hydrolase family protein, partial [Bryobacteraceae bacterium]